MRSKILMLAAVSALLLIFACQKATVPNLVKYKDEAAVPRVSVKEAKADLDAGTAIMIDSRPASAYADEHAAGAMNIPLDTSPDQIKDEIAPAGGKKIFVYCS